MGRSGQEMAGVKRAEGACKTLCTALAAGEDEEGRAEGQEGEKRVAKDVATPPTPASATTSV